MFNDTGFRYCRYAPARVTVERAADPGGPGSITGYAAVFYRPGELATEFNEPGGVTERIARGAFASALARPDDVRALFNHNPDAILGRTTAGTLRLWVDNTGLAYRVQLPDNELGRTVAAAVARGDISGASFSFTPSKIEWGNENARRIRWVQDLQLYDISVVTYPAYVGTSASVQRSAPPEPEPRQFVILRGVRGRPV
jgi:HK97 family phage prohead protease